jgi:hypothetical protein
VRRVWRFVLWLSLCLTLRLGAVAVSPEFADAHPGRTDAQGCHWVRAPFRYADGRIVPQGQHHCHRPLGQLKLDNREVLTEPTEDATGEHLPERMDEPENRP